MQVKFWGVRGSVPWATRVAIGFGCNTPCLELTLDSGERLILDAGSGIVGLGEAMTGAEGPVAVLVTHYHWDHLQGLPFFAPLYRAATPLRLWAPCLDGHDATWIRAIFQSPFFPVPFQELPVPPEIHLVNGMHVTIGSFDIRAAVLNHPGGALAYRIPGARGDLVYATDHEVGVPAVDERLVDFMAGASAVIFDTHFTPEEQLRHRGWGHSSWQDAARLCTEAGVDRLWLFHHKPGRPDEELKAIEAAAQGAFAATRAAAEGEAFEV